MKQMPLIREQEQGAPSAEDVVLPPEVINPLVALMASALIAVVHAVEQDDDAE